MKTEIQLTSILLEGSVNLKKVSATVSDVANGRRLFIYSASFKDQGGTHIDQVSKNMEKAVIHVYGNIGNLQDSLINTLIKECGTAKFISNHDFECFKEELENEFQYSEYHTF